MTQPETNPQFEALLEYLKRSRGFDFTGYKRSTLMRRVNKRMQTLHIEDYSRYVDYLEMHPEEFMHLFNTLLINVTSFFRDRDAWDYISEEIIPRILARKQTHETIRIWTAGCATGEEAYTIAMVFAEKLGIEQFRDRVKIYATDVDEEALDQARQATYLTRDVGGIPLDLLERYFDSQENRHTFRKDLRRSIIFGRHDLIQDAPISKIDLLTCRNALMYFNSETQAKILARFHFALQNGGFLFLGKAEMLLTHANIFLPLDLKRRVFTTVSKTSFRDRQLAMSQPDSEEATNNLPLHLQLHEAVFDTSPIARLVLDTKGTLALVNERARAMFGLSQQDVGRFLQDLEISYRPVELRSCIEQAYKERRTVTLRDIEWKTSMGDFLYLDVQVSPLFDINNTLLGVTVAFVEMTRYKRLQEELEHSNQELEMAYEELQSANEELETTNEELQSSNEELETTNEELQSTNEELETMNEELHSTNEELQTVNDELHRRGEELNQINAFLESILASLKGGVVVLDRELHVQIWNYKAEDLWGLRSYEVVGQHFLNLDIGLPVEQLRQPIRACLNEEATTSELVLPAINRRGKSIQCKVTCTPLNNAGKDHQGVILLMEDHGGESP